MLQAKLGWLQTLMSVHCGTLKHHVLQLSSVLGHLLKHQVRNSCLSPGSAVGVGNSRTAAIKPHKQQWQQGHEPPLQQHQHQQQQEAHQQQQQHCFLVKEHHQQHRHQLLSMFQRSLQQEQAGLPLYYSSSSSSRCIQERLHLFHTSSASSASRGNRTAASNSRAAAVRKQLFLGSSDQSHALYDLHDHLAAAAVPERVVAAVLGKANSWPSLSRDPVELLNRITRLEALMGSAAHAHDMIVSHPQLLTRPPAALEQQLHNLTDWLRVPLLPDQQQQQPGSQARSGPEQDQPDCQALQACQDLMDLVRTSPGCLSVSKDHVTAQLKAVSALLPLLPPLETLLEDQIKASELLLLELQQQQRWKQRQQPAGQQQQRGVADLKNELQHWQQQRQQRYEQQQAVLSAWRAAAAKHQHQHHQHQHHQQQQHVASVNHFVSWPWQLVQGSPEWLFLDPQTTLPRRIDYLTKLLFAGRQDANKQVTNLLLSTPQLIIVNTSHVPGKLRMLQKLLLSHQAVKSSPDYAYWVSDLQERLVIPTLLQSPSLLLPSAKHLQRQGSTLLAVLPLLPLHHFLDLVQQQQQQVQWQQLQFLQHMHILPPTPRVIRQQQQQQRQQSTDLDQIWGAWGFDQYNTAVDALKSDLDVFAAKYPEYRSWQALSAAVDHSLHNGRQSWGWQFEFQDEITGPKLKSWLLSMQGNWHRLLLLTAGQRWTLNHHNHHHNSSSSSRSSSRVGTTSGNRRSRRSSSSSSSSSTGSAVVFKLQDVPVASVSCFPVRPVQDLGPIPFDLPEDQQQQLLSSNRHVLDNTLAQMSDMWQQLAAAATVSPQWQQQLDSVLTLLPEALVAGAESAGSRRRHFNPGSSNPGSSNPGSSNWIQGVVESRSDAQKLAAAAARHQFWKHIQQSDRLDRLIARLQFLHQSGSSPTAVAAAAVAAAARRSSSSSSSCDLWRVLVASDKAFAAAHPQFAAYLLLHKYSEGKSGWRQELSSLQGNDLTHLLTQVAAAHSRLQYLTAAGSSSSSSERSLWQAISLRDAITTSDSQFVELFPEYRFGSWRTLAAMHLSNASAAAAAPDTAASQADQAFPAAAAAHRPTKKRRLNLATQRLQRLQEVAALDRQWSEELSTWQQQQWTTAARVFSPLVARRLEFMLRFREHPSKTQPSGLQDQQSHASSQPPTHSVDHELPSIRTLVASDASWFNKKYPRFRAWNNIDKAVQAIPRWAAEWQSLPPHRLQQLLDIVLQLKAPSLAEVQQHACDQHMRLLKSSSNGSSGSTRMPRGLAALQVGVTGLTAASRSSGGGSSTSKRQPPHLSIHGSSSTDVQHQQHQQQRQQLSGVDLVTHRLNYFSKFKSHASVMATLSLTDVLTTPEPEITQRYKGLDPQVTAARSQGIAEAESRVMQEQYPWLGPKILKPEVLERLSREAKRVLAARPEDLLLLQQVAHTWPDWERQLQEWSADGLSKCLTRVRTRSERLQVMVRAGIQKHNSLKSVLHMDEATWRARYPIAMQLQELQAAAQGVAAWERTLSQIPAGKELLTNIDRLHARRGRLAYLHQQNLVAPGHNALALLQYSKKRFQQRYPEYPGDTEPSS